MMSPNSSCGHDPKAMMDVEFGGAGNGLSIFAATPLASYKRQIAQAHRSEASLCRRNASISSGDDADDAV